VDTEKRKSLLKKSETYLLYVFIIFFFIGFNFQDSRTGGWIQQFMPSLPGNPPLLDITFADSTVGYAVTDKTGDTSYVLKTTNGGTNWFINLKRTDGLRSYRLQCLSKDTVYFGAYFSIYKSFNAGLNWTTIGVPGGTFVYDLFVLNKDTIWYSGGNISTGVLYRTTNAGVTWELQYSGASIVDKIYMYNARIGFMSAGGSFLKTTNSGVNWTIITGENDYTDIYFKDSLVGYKAKTEIKKTTNGGLNWQAQILPNVVGGLTTYKEIDKFSYINDTIYGVKGTVRYPNLQVRGIVFKTLNGGNKWGYQIPDTSLFKNPLYYFTKFIKSKLGWCYYTSQGIFTNIGGDSTIYTGISNINNYISEKFILNQNYPNPFNSTTLISYYIQKEGWVKLKIFDITGKEMGTLVNEVQGVGGYGVPLSIELPSGVYFYKMVFTTKEGIQMETKKMMVIK
jgi:photosystem II stability/assembly factor-like uncharacterized protein